MSAGLIIPTREHLQTILPRLPADERAQYAALTGRRFDANAVADELLATMPQCLVAHTWIDRRGLAYAAGGFVEVAPGTAQSWMAVAEDAWADHAGELHRMAYDISSALLASGAVMRLETWVLASRERARRWYERRLGLKHEHTKARYASGEDVAVYVRFREV